MLLCCRGANQKISVVQFFESNGVPYHAFEKWYKKRFSIPYVADWIIDVLLLTMNVIKC